MRDGRFDKTYDLVLVDAPLYGMVDAIFNASFCSGVVLVSLIGKVTKKPNSHVQATAMLSVKRDLGLQRMNLAA